MKKLYRSLILSLALVTLGGCTDLDEKVYDRITPDNFYKSEQDFISAMGPVYSNMRNLLGWRQWWDLEETTDVALTPVRGGWAWEDGGIYIRLHQQTWLPEDPHFNDIWNTLYAGVNNCNRVLYEMENSTVDLPSRDAFIAEMKVARAFYYFLLCETFGNVPIVDRFDVPEGYLPSTAPRDEVFEFIVDEITENLDALSEDKVATYGRFNRWNALGILARMYINAEAWIGTPMYTECLSVCEEIIGSNKYQLADDFSDNFKLDNHTCKESIFAIPFDEVYSGGQIYSMMRKTMHCWSTAQYNIATWLDGGGCGCPSFFDNYDGFDSEWYTYANTVDQRFHKSWLFGEMHAMDGSLMYGGLFGWNGPIFYIHQVGDMNDQVNGIRTAVDGDGLRFHKYEVKVGARETPDNDWVVMRYAEILYMKAECILRTGGDAQDAADIVNEVRERAFADPAAHLVTGAQLAATSNYYGTPVRYAAMLREWGSETCLEGLRRSQLIRFDDCYTKGEWTYHLPLANNKRNLCPIPLAQIQANGNLEQNPQ